MAKTTVEIYTDEVIRLKYYKVVLGKSTMPDTIRALMNQFGLASVQDIEMIRNYKNRRMPGDSPD